MTSETDSSTIGHVTRLVMPILTDLELDLYDLEYQRRHLAASRSTDPSVRRAPQRSTRTPKAPSPPASTSRRSRWPPA